MHVIARDLGVLYIYAPLNKYMRLVFPIHRHLPETAFRIFNI